VEADSKIMSVSETVWTGCYNEFLMPQNGEINLELGVLGAHFSGFCFRKTVCCKWCR